MQRMQAATANDEHRAAFAIAKLMTNAEFFHAHERGTAICAGRIIEDLRGAFGNRSQHGKAMGDGFIAGNTDGAMDALRRGDLFDHETVL